VAVAETGSISAGAKRLGVPKSVVSERLSELERELGARFLQRSTRKMSLTEDGVAFLERARRILREANDARAELAERRGTLIGPLRLSAPVSFGHLHVGPALYPFLAEHPGIELTLDLDDNYVDVAADGYDAVIRHGPIEDSRLIVKRLASSRRVLVAAPKYLAQHGAPRSLADLEQRTGIVYTNRESDWRFAAPDGWTVVRPVRCLRVNNCLLIRGAALAGLGVTLVPRFLVHAELASGALREIDVDAEPEGGEIFVAYPADRGTSAKVRALTECLRRAFDPPYWDTVAASLVQAAAA